MTRVGIHLGEIHPIRMRCIASQIEAYGKFNLWVSDSNWQGYCNEMISDLKLKSLPDVLNDKTLFGMVQISDWLRFWFASKMPDMLWCDTDLEVIDPIRGLAHYGTPHHGFSDGNGLYGYDHYYFAVNGGCEWYKRGVEFMISRLGSVSQPRWCPALSYVHSEANKNLRPIPQETFRHWAFDPENTETHWQKSC